MKIGEYSINNLARTVCGDSGYTPYLSGYQLVIMFNKYGFADVYEAGFPSRWKYTEDRLRDLNGSDKIKSIVEEIVDPRRYYGLELKVEDAVKNINEILKYDKYELRKSGDFYKVHHTKGSIVEAETTKSLDQTFIQEQIQKCNNKILMEDFDGAITNARSLVEAIFIEIIEKTEGNEIRNDGNIDNLWKKVKKILKLEIDKKTLPDTVIQILSGLDSIVKGLAGLSNDFADRHAKKYNTKKHHAKLAVNVAITISDFLIDSYLYQKK